MTGKEALKLAQDTILANNGNNKSSFTMKNLYLVEDKLNEKDEKLTKYKRAFEILKPSINEIYQIWDEDIYGVEIDECDFRFSKEEYELLEELMMDDTL